MQVNIASKTKSFGAQIGRPVKAEHKGTPTILQCSKMEMEK